MRQRATYAWPARHYRVETLRASLREYSVTFAAAVDLAAAAIVRRATDDAVKRNALLWKLNAIPEMRKACFRPEPVASLIDAWTFVRQMDQLFREGPGANAFGPFQLEALESRVGSSPRSVRSAIPSLFPLRRWQRSSRGSSIPGLPTILFAI
jgi:hypothetical protein